MATSGAAEHPLRAFMREFLPGRPYRLPKTNALMPFVGIHRRGYSLAETKKWQTLFRDADPRLKKWVTSRRFLAPPTAWPFEADPGWPQVAPITLLASGTPTKRMGLLPGIPELYAIAHGWPADDAEVERARIGYDNLSFMTEFAVFAYCPDLRYIPLSALRDQEGQRFKGLTDALIYLRKFEQAPMQTPFPGDTDYWTPEIMKGLPRRTWELKAWAVPLMRGHLDHRRDTTIKKWTLRT